MAGVASGMAAAPRHRERDPDRVAAFEGNEERPAPAAGAPRHERRRDSDAPEWERPRPMEVYPTLRSRRLPELSLPPLLVAVVALALAAAVLFALPGLLGFGGPTSVSSPTPSVAASPGPGQTITPTAVPEPTPVTYVVKAGDTMSKIAKKFGVTLDELIAANATTIPDPDKLAIGDVVTIPVPTPSELPAASAPAASG
jgi:nucleoid-associated protein YgaU